MEFKRAKAGILAVAVLMLFFFSNDFGLIDIEKTAIVTAIGVDLTEDGRFSVTTQVALPEGTGTTSESTKAVVTAEGSTAADAFGNIGSKTGWFPKLSFCNLILLGKSMENTDVSKVLDFFARTIKIQDSALVAMTDGLAKDYLTVCSPLDNISSFSLQKVLLVKAGMDNDVLTADIKDFSVGYFSRARTNFMPYIRMEEGGPSDVAQSSGGSGGSGGDSGGGSGGGQTPKTALFDATQTALFKNGYYVGKLNEKETLAAVFVKNRVENSGYPVRDVMINGERIHFFLNIIKSTPKINVSLDKENKVSVVVHEDIYVKIDDETAHEKSLSYLPTLFLPEELLNATKAKMQESFDSLVEICRETKSDLFDVDLALYRKYPARYEDAAKTFWDTVEVNLELNLYAQKKV